MDSDFSASRKDDGFDPRPRLRTIGEVADLAGVTINALRKYDKIGLFRPVARSSGGHRLYGDEELRRLREILVWRALGFPLADIRVLVDDPDHDQGEALRRQREIAASQQERFRELTRGLDMALAAVDEGQSPAEDRLLVGFAQSLQEGDGDRPPGPTFARLSGRSPHGTANGFGVDFPKRIVATDPIRIAENLLALGIVPCGTLKYPDRWWHLEGDPSGLASGEGSGWPWSPFVEPVVRSRIRELGIEWGLLDLGAVEEVRPDLVFCWPHAWEADPLGEIAPVELLDWRFEPPGFVTWLRQIGDRLGLTHRVEGLIATWEARTRALRGHLEGKEVSVLHAWRLDGPDKHLSVPTADYDAQVFTEAGVYITQPSSAERRGKGDRLDVDGASLAELDAPVLFAGAYLSSRQAVRDLYASKLFRDLPAVRRQQVVYQDWDGVRSGWFSAHWQLYCVAQAFGLVQIQASDNEMEVHGAVNVRSGLITFAPVFRDMRVTLSGPELVATQIELSRDGVAHAGLGRNAAFGLAMHPELYSLRDDDSTICVMRHDRETARSRITL